MLYQLIQGGEGECPCNKVVTLICLKDTIVLNNVAIFNRQSKLALAAVSNQEGAISIVSSLEKILCLWPLDVAKVPPADRV